MASSVSPTKFAPVDWHTSNLLLSSTADRQRQVSHDIRQISTTTRNVTGELCCYITLHNGITCISESNTDWTQHGTDTQLAYRIRDIDDWKRDLTTTLRNVEMEIAKVVHSLHSMSGLVWQRRQTMSGPGGRGRVCMNPLLTWTIHGTM